MASSQAQKYKELGNDAFRKKEYGKAIENYTYAVECDPKDAKLYTNRAACYASMAEWDKVLRDAERSISLDPSWMKGWFRKGQAKMEKKEYQVFRRCHVKEAFEAFSKCVAMEPDSADAKNQRDAAEKLWKKDFTPAMFEKDKGNQLFKLGKIPEAVASYSRALELCTADEIKTKADLYNNRSLCWVQLYEPSKVVEDCSAALELQENNIKALLRRGTAYESLEKLPAALKDFERVCILDSSVEMAQKSAARCRNLLKAQGKFQ